VSKGVERVVGRGIHLLRQPEFHIFLFCLLFILINWPFLAISTENGLMSSFVYLFLLWAILIILMFLIQRSLRDKASGEEKDDEGGG
jgi:hypothetical protein